MSLISAIGKPEPCDSPVGFVVLDRRDPLPSARKLVATNYTTKGLRTLHYYRGVFYQWNGSSYVEGDHDAIRTAIWLFLEQAFHQKIDGVERFQPNRVRVADIFSALAAVCELRGDTETPCWLGENSDLPAAQEFLAVKNGLLHLPSGDLYTPSPEYFCLSSAHADFNAEAPEPKRWSQFLSQIWPDDRQSIDALQEIFGLLLSPDTSQQKIILIVGPKRSGKGTMSRILTELLGHKSVCNPTLASLETNFGLAPLIGKSVAIIGDARLSGRTDQSKVSERLLSISGEDGQTVDRKHLSAWTGRLSVRFIIMTNELPRLADASGALASRFIVLQMQNSFYGKEDRGLAAQLLLELPGILNWALVGYSRLRRRGHLIQPESARDAIDELEALGSPIATFLKERCRTEPGLQCPVSCVYSEWKLWCEANGRREPGTTATFGRDLRAAVPGLKMKNLRDGNGGRNRFYEGLDIRASNWENG